MPHVDFCGELFPFTHERPVVVGRGGDVQLDDNPYLHRRFLEVGGDGSLWWLSNVGTTLTATVSDDAGLLQAWLAPGARLPIVFARTVVLFTAGPTTYELDIVLEEPSFRPVDPVVAEEEGSTTLGRTALTPDQKLLIVALAEPLLRRGPRGPGAVPSSADAARRLGWTLTKFNRKLDNVCEKFARTGVRGLHGDPARLASNRRARLVEYSIGTRVVTAADLSLLPD